MQPREWWFSDNEPTPGFQDVDKARDQVYVHCCLIVKMCVVCGL